MEEILCGDEHGRYDKNKTADPLGLATNIELKAPEPEPVKAPGDSDDDILWTSKSDKDQIDMIRERAKTESPAFFGDANQTKKKGMAWGDEDTDGGAVPNMMKNTKKPIIPEEAVLKIVQNMDSNAVTAEAM